MEDSRLPLPQRTRLQFDPELLYDVNIAVLTHCADGNMLRIDCMKKFGVINPRKYKVHITLIVNPGDYDKLDRIIDGWSATKDVSVIEMPSCHPLPKINGYYLWLMESGLSARWHGRVDDDSMTDIASALEYLDERFDGSPVHVATGPMIPNEHEPLFGPFLLERGIFLRHVHTEWESSFTTSLGMRRIFSNQLAKWMIEETSWRFKAPGDRALAFAAHLADVPVVENTGSRLWFDLERFSLFGGDLHHIHYVPWKNKDLVQRLTAYFSNENLEIKSETMDMLLRSPMILHLGNRSHALVTLSSPNCVTGGMDHSITSWSFQDGVLRLNDSCGDSFATFLRVIPDEGGLSLRGYRTKDRRPCLLRFDALLVADRRPRSNPYRPFVHAPGKPSRGHYLRLGHDQRPMQFAVDGSITEGSADCERRWRLRNMGGNVVLEIEGDSGLTCRLREFEDGIWRGSLLIGEQMPVAIILSN